VVGRDRVCEEAHDARIMHIFERCRCIGQLFKVRRVLNIGAVIVPPVCFAFACFDGLPVAVAFEYVAVAFAEHFWSHSCTDRIGDLFIGWPDVLQIDVFAILAFADGLFGEVFRHRASKGVGHNQWR